MFRPPDSLYRRPRLLNPLHALKLVQAHSQTNEQELARLGSYAKGHQIAVEIGSHMGVSAAVIAHAVGPDGKVFCIDPWDPVNQKENPCLSIFKRELSRQDLLDRVHLVQGLSYEVEQFLPTSFDFAFVDGDHTYEGLKRDWAIVERRLAPNGIVCLHDTSTPDAEPYRRAGSVRFFKECIRNHRDFEWLECCYTMNVLRKR